MDPREAFAELVQRPDTPLDRAALALAACAEPGVEAGYWLAELDRLAAGVDGLDGLRRRLFDQAGFSGDAEDYYDPDNSFLHRVLQRRRGIPITLSVVAIEVGRRVGVRLEGIGMPGHFLARDIDSGVYLDAFSGGELLDLAGCEDRFRAATGAGSDVEFGPSLLRAVTTKEILARMLANLRSVYRAAGRAADLEWVLHLRLLLPDAGPADAVEFGEVLAAQGRIREGAKAVEDFAERAPADADTLAAAGRALRSRLN